jgi:hypothetical protein
MKKEDKVQSEVVEYILEQKVKKYQYTVAQYFLRFVGLGSLVFANDPVQMLPIAALLLMFGEAAGAARDL